MSVADLNAAIAASLTLLQQVAPATNSAVGSLQSGENQITVISQSIIQQVNAASGSFANLLKNIGQYQAFGGMGQIGPSGEVGPPVMLADLFQKLAVLIQEQRALNAGHLQVSPSEHFNIEDSIQKIVQIIRTYGGPAASAFDLSRFKQFLDSGGGAQAVANSLGIPAAAPSGTSSGGAASLGNDAVAQPGTPVAPTAPRYALLPGQRAPENTSLTAEQKQLDDLNKTADKLNAAVSTAEANLQAANAEMTKLATKAGIDDKNGAVQKLNAQLQDAQATLQYLQDIGESDAKVKNQQSIVNQIQKQLDDANKQLRITTYEFEHSPAYQKQLDAIAAAQKDLDAKQKAADDNAAKIDALQKKIDDATKAATDAADTVKKVGGAMVLSLSTTGETVTKSLKTESVAASAKISAATDGAVKALNQTFASFVDFMRKGIKPGAPPTGGGALIGSSIHSARSMGLVP